MGKRQRRPDRNGDRYGNVIKEFSPLRERGAERLDVRVIERGKGRYVDIRQYVEDAESDFRGYTRRGISLSPEEWGALMELAKRITRLLGE